MKVIRNILIAGFLIFVAVGWWTADSETLKIAQYLWLLVGATFVLAFAGASTAGVVWLWSEAKQRRYVFPDENGNYPIDPHGKNFNLPTDVSPEMMQAWLAWMLTNNKSGTQPREVIQRFLGESPASQQPALGAQIREVRSEREAPPILLEARRVAERLAQ